MSHYLAVNQASKQAKQAGFSMIVMLIMVAILLFILIVAMKVAPAYVEHMNVKRVLKAMDQESLSTMSKKEIKESFNKRSGINDISIIKDSDLEITQNDAGKTVVSVEYQAVRPVMDNVSVVIDFKASSDD